MVKPSNVRTRVAPSPTGDPHIGTAYMALFNYAFARSQGGHFILRIEDTDQVRSTRESEEAIYRALQWVGLTWDEGPDVGGAFGPYRQSERTEIYQEYCQLLVENGQAYYDFATADQVEAIKNEQNAAGENPRYTGQYAETAERAKERIAAGETAVVRLKVPDEGECIFHDRLRGEIRIPWSQVDHQVLLKSDGFPTYHLANVVDDHLMEITHVIRGEEWINSAPKHLLLYQALGWEAPEFIHLPLLRNPDKSKLSKRKNPTGIVYYERAGYFPEALLNYLGLMAFSMPDEREMFTLEEFVEAFEIDRVSLGGPIFDLQKLQWLNGRYMRETLDAEEIYQRLVQWQLNDVILKRVLPLVQPRADKLSDIMPALGFLFSDQPEYPTESLISKKLDGAGTARLVRIVLWEMEKLSEWNRDLLKDCFGTIAEKEELKLRDLMPTFYVAITGAPASIPLFDAMEVLGSEMSRRRLYNALDRLEAEGHGISKKQMKKLEKDYLARY